MNHEGRRKCREIQPNSSGPEVSEPWVRVAHFRSNDDADLIRLNRSNALSLEHRSAAKLVTDGGASNSPINSYSGSKELLGFGLGTENHVAGLDEGTAIADGDGEKHFIGLQVKFHWRRLIIL